MSDLPPLEDKRSELQRLEMHKERIRSKIEAFKSLQMQSVPLEEDSFYGKKPGVVYTDDLPTPSVSHTVKNDFSQDQSHYKGKEVITTAARELTICQLEMIKQGAIAGEFNKDNDPMQLYKIGNKKPNTEMI